MDEFALIRKYFAPLGKGFSGALGLTDDAALIDPPPGCELVVTKDAISEGVHFTGHEPPGLIARKLLRVNLSDLASMGAVPMAYFLAVMLPSSIRENWIADFALGLAEDQRSFGITLAGGDTTATKGSLSLSLTAIGSVPRGRSLKRSGARPDDEIFVSGTLGDGAIGLRAEQGRLPGLSKEEEQFLIDRYRLPQPRLALGQALRGIANACIDVSDGLAQDMGHICAASGCAAVLESKFLPLSSAARHAIRLFPEAGMDIFSGGDDYELLFTVPPDRLPELPEGCTRIGSMRRGGGVTVLDDRGNPIALEKTGWKHF